ncbi:MAG: hypothetical protein VX427_11220 [Acidobacteriota bacterium]|nr:hypothetical protein [Acidobacteriota bacterium]
MANVPPGRSTLRTETSVRRRSWFRSSDCKTPYGAITRLKGLSDANGNDRMSPRKAKHVGGTVETDHRLPGPGHGQQHPAGAAP